MSLAELKKKTADIERVAKWLAHIGEMDKSTIDEVLENCTNDKEAREYFVKRYESECKVKKADTGKSDMDSARADCW